MNDLNNEKQSINEVIELIRREKVVLWLGAGFSRYAGYKLGKEFSIKLSKHLSDDLKKELDLNNLPIVSQTIESFLKQKGKNIILKEIEYEYIKKKPLTSKYHKILSKILHFPAIITTNYDRLIENGYKDKCHLIINDTDLAKIPNEKIQIIKIHGDPKFKKSIIISTNDYENLINNSNNSLIWNHTLSLMAQYSQVFIGFQLEDIDIILQNNKVKGLLGGNTNKNYLIIPEAPEYKRRNLQNQNIQHIAGTGENFIEELEKSLQKNIKNDYQNGLVTERAFAHFLKKHDLNSNINPDKKEVLNIFPIEKEFKSTISFNADNNHFSSLSEFYRGDILESVTIPVNKLSNVLNNISIVEFDKDTEITIKRLPVKKTLADIYIDNEKFELIDIPVEVFATPISLTFKFTLKAGVFSYTLSVKDRKINGSSTFKIEHSEKFNSPYNEIKYFGLLNFLAKGSKIRFKFNDDLELPVAYGQLNEDMVKDSSFYLNLFEKLKVLEKAYNLKIKPYELTDDLIHSISICYSVFINEPYQREVMTNYEFNLSEVLVDKLKEIVDLKNEANNLTIESGDFKRVNLFDKTIDLGYEKLLIPKGQFLNLNELISSQTQVMILKNISGFDILTYSKS